MSFKYFLLDIRRKRTDLKKWLVCYSFGCISFGSYYIRKMFPIKLVLSGDTTSLKSATDNVQSTILEG